MAKSKNLKKSKSNNNYVALISLIIIMLIIGFVVYTQKENETKSDSIGLVQQSQPQVQEIKIENPHQVTKSQQPQMALENSITPVVGSLDDNLNPKPKANNNSITEAKLYNTKDIGAYVVSLHQDHLGRIWAGTEDLGVFCSDSNSQDFSKWKKYTVQDGLGDNNVYAITHDKHGLIWVGHQDTGLSIFNGEYWKHYDRIHGALGERIFDIATSPINGDVWIASNSGIARYSVDLDTWSYCNRAGWLPTKHDKPLGMLPEDQISAISFDSDGTIFIGFKTSGLAIGKPDNDYSSWDFVTDNNSHDSDDQFIGSGLPSNQINDILVANNGDIYVGTVRGLARSINHGKSWSYIRGLDAIDKLKRSFTGPDSGWKEPSKLQREKLLPEDYVTSLREDKQGRIWISFRTHGIYVGHPDVDWKVNLTTSELGLNEKAFFIDSILPLDNNKLLVAGYGNKSQGLALVDVGLPDLKDLSHKKSAALPASKLKPQKATTKPELSITDPPKFPSNARAPNLEELVFLQHKLQSQLEQPADYWGEYLGEDWQTKGDWVGRYGKGRAILCAMDAPMDHDIGYGTHYFIKGFTGPNGAKNEALRHWCHKIRWDDPRVLYSPIDGYRRQADWDDHAEAYPITHEGPDVWVEVEVYQGIHEVALYFFNKDGHESHNRFRDYLLELKTYNQDPQKTHKSKPIATARVSEFWGGVYQSFILKGPNKYLIKIGCNDSFNTIVSGVFCQPLDAKWPYEKIGLAWMGGVPYKPKPVTTSNDWSLTLKEAVKLWDMSEPKMTSAYVSGMKTYQLLALRAAVHENLAKELIYNWKWKLRIWDNELRKEFQLKVKEGFVTIHKNNEENNKRTPEYLYEKYFKNYKKKDETP